MQYCEKQTEQWGKVLWVTTDYAEVGIALDFGIRVVHISCPGMEKVVYTKVTPEMAARIVAEHVVGGKPVV